MTQIPVELNAFALRFRDHQEAKKNARLKRKKVMKRRSRTDVSASVPVA